MRAIVVIAGLAIAVTALPEASQASCPRRTTGTVVGALAGGLLGSAVAGHGARTEGTLLGAAAGGVVGNQVSKCGPSHHTYSRARTTTHRAAYDDRAQAYASSDRYAQSDRCAYEQRPYYDPYGRMVYQPTLVCGR